MQSYILKVMANEAETKPSCCQQEPGVNLVVPTQGTALFGNVMGPRPSQLPSPWLLNDHMGGCLLLSQQNQHNWLRVCFATQTGTSAVE